MKIKTVIICKCPVCHSIYLKKVGKSIGGTQLLQCKSCGWAFPLPE